MPRPRKDRKICMMPRCTEFGPRRTSPEGPIAMAVDEYEAIRLIDLEGLTQEQCAARMEVARTTIQAIYAAARNKLARCIVEGHSLVIDGGEYRMCDREGEFCCHGCCRMRTEPCSREKELGDEEP